MGRRLVLGVSHMPRPQGAGPKLSPILGILLFMSTPFVAELPNRTWYHMSGRGVYLGVSHAFHPKRAEFQHSQISGFSRIYAYAL